MLSAISEEGLSVHSQAQGICLLAVTLTVFLPFHENDNGIHGWQLILLEKRVSGYAFTERLSIDFGCLGGDHQ